MYIVMELLFCLEIKISRRVSTYSSIQTHKSCSQPFLKCQVLFLLHCSNMLQIEGHRTGSQSNCFVHKILWICSDFLMKGKSLCEDSHDQSIWVSCSSKPFGDVCKNACVINGQVLIPSSDLSCSLRVWVLSNHEFVLTVSSTALKKVSQALEAVRYYHSNKCHRGHHYFPCSETIMYISGRWIILVLYNSSPKNENSVIIYLPSYCSKPV